MIGHYVDVIVNSANNYLIPGSGLAKYLRRKLPKRYENSCNDLLSRNKLEKGKAYFIPLPNQYRMKAGIIEAITIEYYKNKKGLTRIESNSKDIYNCIYASLELCDEKGFKSIAFPQMASRPGYSIYKEQPYRKMIASTFLAINDYLESTNSNIKEIFIHPSDLESEELFLILFNNEILLRTMYIKS